MVGTGFEQASCAIIGNQLGRGDVKSAKDFYGTLRHIAFWTIMATTLVQYIFRKEIVGAYLNRENPDVDSVRSQALATIPLFVFNILPDLFKGMLSGIIKALAIQNKAVKVNLLCHWFIYPLSTFILAFKFDFGLRGFWIAKIILECFIVSFYSLIIYQTDWH